VLHAAAPRVTAAAMAAAAAAAAAQACEPCRLLRSLQKLKSMKNSTALLEALTAASSSSSSSSSGVHPGAAGDLRAGCVSGLMSAFCGDLAAVLGEQEHAQLGEKSGHSTASG
jgi:hypothetical protein